MNKMNAKIINDIKNFLSSIVNNSTARKVILLTALLLFAGFISSRLFFNGSLKRAVEAVRKAETFNRMQLQRLQSVDVDKQPEPVPSPQKIALVPREVTTGALSPVTYTAVVLGESDYIFEIKRPHSFAINNIGNVVWVNDRQIFVYDGKSVKQLKLKKRADEIYNLQINNRGEVVWMGSFRGGDGDIFFYNGKKIIQLPTLNKLKPGFEPQLNDRGEIVFWSPDGGIFLYRGGNLLRLTDDTLHHKCPKINNRGEIVWEVSFFPDDTEIMFYDGQAVRQFTDNNDQDYSPQINDQGKVAWLGNVGRWNQRGEILLSDGKEVTWLTDNKIKEKRNIRINGEGQVVWEEYDGHDWEIFFDDGKTLLQLTDNATDDSAPQVNDKGEVVWCGIGEDVFRHQIFLYDGKSVKQFTAGTELLYNNFNPQINNQGDIIWAARFKSGKEYEYSIFLAKKDVVGTPDPVSSMLTDDKASHIKEATVIEQKAPFTNIHSYATVVFTNKWNIVRDFQINPKGHTAWAQRDADDLEIFLYDGKLHRLTENFYDDVGPWVTLSGSVFWEAQDGNKWKIFFYDGKTVTALMEGTQRCEYIKINSRGQAAWKGYEGNISGVFFYDGKAVTKLPQGSGKVKDIQLSEQGYLAWESDDGNKSDIFLYDGKAVKNLSNNSFFGYLPKINERGDVAWGGGGKIFLYDGLGVKVLTDKSEMGGEVKQINAQGYVLWQAYDGIFLYNNEHIIKLTDGGPNNNPIYRAGVAPFTGSDANDCALHMNEEGQVVWSVRGSVFFYDGKDVIKLWNNLIPAAGSSESQIGAKGQVAWKTDGKIFYYNGEGVIRLTDEEHSKNNEMLQMNKRGQIVWCGSDGQDSEIFLYDGQEVIQVTDNNNVNDTHPQIDDQGNLMWSLGDGGIMAFATQDPQLSGFVLSRDEAQVSFKPQEILMSQAPLGDAHSYTITQIKNDFASVEPDMNDRGDIVWCEYLGSYGQGGAQSYAEIFLKYDGKEKKQLTKNRHEDLYPQINNRGEVVWFGNKDGGENAIFFYDGTAETNLASKLSVTPISGPLINEKGFVAWIGSDWEGNHLFFYDGKTVKKIARNPYGQESVQINDKGEVAWYTVFNGITILFYDGKEVKQIAENSNGAGSNWRILSLNDQGQMAWSASDGGDCEIFFYDGRVITKLTHNLYDDLTPKINNRGQVAWVGDERLFFYDGTNIIQLVNKREEKYSISTPQINDEGYIAWVQRGERSSNYALFLYDGKSIIQLADNVDYNLHFRINNRGDVIWSANGAIFVAKKNPDESGVNK